jgi:hypothetical protein
MLAASTVFLAAAMPSDVTINVDTSAVTHQVDPMFMVRRFPIYSACWHARSWSSGKANYNDSSPPLLPSHAGLSFRQRFCAHGT